MALLVAVIISVAIAIGVSALGFDSASVYVGGTILALLVVSSIAHFLQEIRTPQQTS